MVRRCQCRFGQQEAEQDECRSRIRSHDSFLASNGPVQPTDIEVDSGGLRDFCHVLREIPPISPAPVFPVSGGTRPRNRGPRAAPCHAQCAHVTVRVGAGVPPRRTAERAGVTEGPGRRGSSDNPLRDRTRFGRKAPLGTCCHLDERSLDLIPWWMVESGRSTA